MVASIVPVDAGWAGVLIIVSLGLFLAAGMVGWMLYLNRMDDR